MEISRYLNDSTLQLKFCVFASCGNAHCGICAESICYFKVWNFLTVNPATSPTAHIPSKPHTLPLSFPLLLFLSLSVSCMHMFMHLPSLAASPLTFARHQRATHAWQVATVLLERRCADGADRLVFLCTSLSFSLYICPSLLR